MIIINYDPATELLNPMTLVGLILPKSGIIYMQPPLPSKKNELFLLHLSMEIFYIHMLYFSFAVIMLLCGMIIRQAV